MSDDEPAVKVTLAKIYEELLTVRDAVTPLPDKVSDHEVRIRAIEKYLWIWIGASGVLGAGASALLQYLFSSPK